MVVGGGVEGIFHWVGDEQDGGSDPLKKYMSDAITLDQWVGRYKGESYFDMITEDGWKQAQPKGPIKRYVINPNDGNVMDMRHVMVVGYGYGNPFGDVIEHIQNLHPSTRPSAFDPQDYYSNDIGDAFAIHTVFNSSQWFNESWAVRFSKFIKANGGN